MNSLPVEVTSYVGRQRELREAKRLLSAASLVTLTGPGGVGKTRLASRAAEAARSSFGGEVVFIGLAELHEPDLLVSTVAGLLGLGERSARPPVERVVDLLRTRRVLLVLDNCEHLIEACAQLVDALIRACPELVVLATSRQSLGVVGERVLPIPPLAVPEPGESAGSPDQHDAVRLFVDRAVAVVPFFKLTEHNVEDVAKLCRSLDGLPLAIELAAVRLRSLSVRQLADRLNKRFTLLTQGDRQGPSRHETLQALIDWSHELCTPRERLLWARAAVFPGSFDLEAAEAVCAGEGLDKASVLDVVDGLIDKSILLRDDDQGSARYRMLETVRQYGEERLRSSGALPLMRRRHRDRYRELAGSFEAGWLGPDQIVWINRLKREHANLRGALDFCASDPAEAVVGLAMIHTIKEYWLIRGLNTEGRIWLAKLLEVAPPEAPGRAASLWMSAFLALVQSDRPVFETLLAKANQLAEATGDEKARAYVHHVRGYAALIDNDGEQALDEFKLSSKMLADQHDLGGELWSTYNYGMALSLAGDLTSSRRVLADCIERYTSLGEMFWRSWALWSLSAAEYLYGDLGESVKASHRLLRLQLRIDDRAVIAFSLTVLAGTATHSGEWVKAARMLGAASAVWESLGASPATYTAFIEPMHRDITLVTGELGVEDAAKEFIVGAALSVNEAVRYALGEEPAGTDAGKRSADNPLTRRESEIAELVAQGMTNREIADRLVIARRTAETHVDHILGKLGFTNRAQIAAWVVQSRRS
ncbi:ATP-binding protein [Amycolatopsis sp. H20-H5]|uniref:ATP-binding protein n=1 Tax=Amycolatopsis sp. H20-H5 TaxID=3046309 RepID=UPI002DBC87BE|nr:LuxR C-terminal-related transcriptional regulator [Amycolatopsis sp. H20-H5]MEC3981463.1 LuxR C-terminal-related transcriptional regulator [Amycolatopsis sp. H20-H5]